MMQKLRVVARVEWNISDSGQHDDIVTLLRCGNTKVGLSVDPTTNDDFL
jgi:hypothetical protein